MYYCLTRLAATDVLMATPIVIVMESRIQAPRQRSVVDARDFIVRPITTIASVSQDV